MCPKVPEYDLHMTYYPAFRACVEAGSAGLMCSYNRFVSLTCYTTAWIG